MKFPRIFAVSLGLAFAVAGASASSAKADSKIMIENAGNPFADALAIAVQERAGMRGQRHELKPLVENLFAGQSTAAFSEFLSQIVARDLPFRAVKLNVPAIGDALANGQKFAIGFTPDQIRAIIGEAGAFHSEDTVVLAFSTDHSTGAVKIDAAAIVNKKLYP
ncbi:hypothetical protein [Bosea massiliensis]|uniref:Uncharacterized protein n=1 Tax=Bosea massiliensis TaxID=151419 RepID=A0ABW0NZ61_9HYPH